MFTARKQLIPKLTRALHTTNPLRVQAHEAGFVFE